MKKLLIISAVFLLTGCSMSTNLQTNFFRNIWNQALNDDAETSTIESAIGTDKRCEELWTQHVIKKNTSIRNNISQELVTQQNKENFLNTCFQINDLRNYLIIGESVVLPEITEPVFREGFMNIADQHGTQLVTRLQESVDIIDGDNNSLSLDAVIKDMKKNIQKTCLLQKVDVDCKF